MDDSTDAVRACLRLVRFFARESCGKCSPCREGTTWEEKILQRILDGHGRPSDIDLLLDVADNISPGPYPVAADPAAGLEAVPFPPRQTTICPLGPSSVAPITSALRRFRGEFDAKITRRDPIAVAVGAGHGRRPRRPVARSEAVMAEKAPHHRDHRPGRASPSTVSRVTAQDGELLIDACERNGAYIPRFCYHPRMTPVGMCRMCLVEVDSGRGPALQPSCMIPVADGHGGGHRPRRVAKAQDGVLEFLLANHPLDCPVCDKGGECPLQDQTYAYGPGESRFVEEKRHYAEADRDLRDRATSTASAASSVTAAPGSPTRSPATR